MHRKIPKSNRHKKIKAVDPFCRDGRRKLLDKKAVKANRKPIDDDIQEVPRKVREMMAAVDGLEVDKKKLKKRKMTRGPHEFGVSVDDSDVDEGETDPDGGKIPVLKRNPGESVEAFMRRVDSTVREAVYETKLEIEREEGKEGENSEKKYDEKDDESLENQRNKKKNKNKRKKEKQRPLKSIRKKEKRKLYAKEKTASKKKKVSDQVDSFGHLRDCVPFGEVTHNPPVISANLRKCGDSSSDRRPGTKALLLRNMLTKTAADPKAKSVRLPTAPSSNLTAARKSLTAGDRRSLEFERQKAIAAYRLIKARHRSSNAVGNNKHGLHNGRINILRPSFRREAREDCNCTCCCAKAKSIGKGPTDECSCSTGSHRRREGKINKPVTCPGTMPHARLSKKGRENEDEEEEDGEEADDPANQSPRSSFRLPVRNAVECLLLSVSIASTDDAQVEARLRKQADESLAAHLRRSLESFRPLMSSSTFEPRLDPLSVDSFQLDETAGLTEVRASFSDVVVTGMSGFEVLVCAVSLKGPLLRLSLGVPRVLVQGTYRLQGKAVGILPLTGSGGFRVVAKDLIASGVALLSVGGSRVALSSLVLQLDVDDVNVNFDNLLGGGALGGVANNVASALSKSTFERVKPRLLQGLQGALRSRLNEELMHLDALGVIHQGFAMGARSNANIYMDQVLDKARDQIKHGGMDPLSLQDGPVFTDGQLVGLSTVYRSGDGNLSFSPQAVTLEAHLGFVDLRATYKWSRKVLLRLSGRVGARASDVSVFIRIRQPTKSGSNPVVESFEIERMGRISVDLSGLGPVSWVAQKLVSFVSNLMRRRVAERLRGPVRQIIENSLGNVNMPFG